jgi:NAD(P)-dependent dehydrogenase (short-subunit alcohol dehydrogenase family)
MPEAHLDAPHHAVITGGSRGIGRAILIRARANDRAILIRARANEMCGHRQLVRNTDAAEEVFDVSQPPESYFEQDTQECSRPNEVESRSSAKRLRIILTNLCCIARVALQQTQPEVQGMSEFWRFSL